MAPKNQRPINQVMPSVPDTPPVHPIEEEPPQNAYYAQVSNRYRAAKYAAVFLLVLVIVAGLITGADSITYANFVYLLRDFDTVLNASSSEAAVSVRYGGDDTQQYLLYRDNLTLVGADEVGIYNTAGKQTLREDHGLETPVAAASDRYLMLWDLGGHQYSLYNSLTRIHTETLEYPIRGGTISDSGLYAVITQTREYTSAVMLYGKNGKLKNRYLKDKYVIDVAISADGKRIAILSVEAFEGAYRTEVQLCRPGDAESISTLTLPGAFPMAVRFLADNTAVVLCDDALRFYGDDGSLLQTRMFDNGPPARFVCSGRHTALAFGADAAGYATHVVVLSDAGDSCYEWTVDEKVQALTLFDSTAYLLTDRSMLRLDADQIASAQYDGGGKALLADGRGVLLCTAATAYRYGAEQFSPVESLQEN
ncbi:MAG: hypothetical protein IKL84_01295 [Clostridia bacterium]|nr:hypothetical protein [Clostridia bacterium]